VDDGLAAVELAILLPVLLGLVLAAIDFGLAFRQQIMLRNAASSAAQYAAVQPCDTAGIVSKAKTELQNVSVLKPTPSLSPAPVFMDQSGSPAGDCTTAYQVRITVSASYTLLTGGFLGLFGVPNSVPVSGQQTVRIQGH
jgi:Flp pilus assembly protein TadG